MGKIIAIANQKGGVGKTTTAVNLSSCLSVLQKKVLLIDTDPQANATHALGFLTNHIQYGTFEFLDGSLKSKNYISKIPETNPFDFIPTKINLALFETQPKNNIEFYKLKNALADIKNDYDFIIIDCSPNLGLLLLNALCAADSVLIPVQCEYFAFEGLKKILKTFKTVRSNYNAKLDIEGILLTMFNPNQNMDQDVKKQVESYFHELMLDTIIYRNIKLTEAPSHGKSIYEYNINSKGAINYLNLANEIILINNSALSNTNKRLGKSLSDILKEDYLNDIDFIVNINTTNESTSFEKNFNTLIGLSKGIIKERLGLTYNDIHSNVWMFRINERFSFLKKNYLYIYFKNSKAVRVELKRLKQNEEKNKLLLEKYTSNKPLS